jgi:hypothetical protein
MRRLLPVTAFTMLSMAFASHPAFAELLCDTSLGCELPSTTPGALKNARETRFVAGVQLDLGTLAPSLYFAVRSAETTTHDQVYGAMLDVSVPALPQLLDANPIVRVMGLAGNRGFQGEAGAGLRVRDLAPVLAAGVQAPYVNGGLNYIWGDGLHPYAGVSTFGRAIAPHRRGGTQSCPSGYSLTPVTNGTLLYDTFTIPVAATVTSGGNTCFTPLT